jgi:hypothetical protein
MIIVSHKEKKWNEEIKKNIGIGALRFNGGLFFVVLEWE